MAFAQSASNDSKSPLLDPTKRAAVQLTFLARRQVTERQKLSFLKEVEAAHTELVKHGTKAQRKYISELEENGTPEFSWALAVSRTHYRRALTLNAA